MYLPPLLIKVALIPGSQQVIVSPPGRIFPPHGRMGYGTLVDLYTFPSPHSFRDEAYLPLPSVIRESTGYPPIIIPPFNITRLRNTSFLYLKT